MNRSSSGRFEHFLRLPRKLPTTEQSESLMQRWLMEQRALVTDALSVCESPREYDFGLALLASGDAKGSFLRLSDPERRPIGVFAAEGRGLQVFAQYELTLSFGLIRIDFAIFGPIKRVAVEIDGHDGHKTREQRSADARRDRELESLGWETPRITGSELYQVGAQQLADEILRRFGLKPAVGSPLPATPPPEPPSLSAPRLPVNASIEEENAFLRAVQERAKRRLAGEAK